MAQKRVQLLRELLPTLRTLAILSNINHPGEQSEHKVTEEAGRALSIGLVYVPFSSGLEINGALERVHAARPDAMVVFPEGVTMVHRAKIVEFAKANRLPSMFGWQEL